MPRDPENAQSGLDVLLEPIARGLGDRFSEFIYMNVYEEILEEFPVFFKNKAIRGALPKMAFANLVRYTPLLRKDETDVLDKLSSRISKTNEILFVVGADIRLVARARYIAKKIGCTYHIYFIDDPKSSLLVKRGGCIRYILWHPVFKAFLKNAGCVFSHTKIHVKALATGFGRPVIELPLPWYGNQYDPMVKRQSNGSDRIFYLGSINYLYKENLLSLYGAIKAVNVRTGSNIELLTTAKFINDTAPYSKHARLAADEIKVEAMGARHCLLVYSFQRKYHDIIESSFPSKIFQYIPSATSIIYYGPESHVLADLAMQSAGYIIYVKDRIQLELLLSQEGRQEITLSNEQNEFIKSFMYRYSVENFASIINLSITSYYENTCCLAKISICR
jgi:hypothetical protein